MTEYAGFGTMLGIGDTDDQATAVFTTVAQVQDISGPGLSLNTDDVTAHDSPGAFEEFVATTISAGEVSFDIVYDPVETTHKNAAGGLLYELLQRTKKAFQITFTDSGATVWKFVAFVTGYEPSEPVDGKLAASITLQITGQPTLV